MRRGRRKKNMLHFKTKKRKILGVQKENPNYWLEIQKKKRMSVVLGQTMGSKEDE